MPPNPSPNDQIMVKLVEVVASLKKRLDTLEGGDATTPSKQVAQIVDNVLAKVKGDKGDQGEQGKEGKQGEMGPQGNDGAQGTQGVQGMKGEQGERGLEGLQGAQGASGRDGQNGKDGKDGVDGFVEQTSLDSFEKRVRALETTNHSGGSVSQSSVQLNLGKLFTHEKFSTSSATTTITLANKVAGNVCIWLRYQGQMLHYGDQYTVSNKTVTFTFTLDDSSEVNVTYLKG